MRGLRALSGSAFFAPLRETVFTPGRKDAGKTNHRPLENKMFLGLRTAIYHVDDIDRGKAWYTQVLGFGPYFDEPFYVGFNVAGYELGLQPAERSDGEKAEGAVAYWGVENAEAAFKRIIELGATVHEEVQDVGGGIKVATVKDPFGNIFGIIENPHFKIQ
jgi:predicted enzyme related to lactoylglutathione lyase